MLKKPKKYTTAALIAPRKYDNSKLKSSVKSVLSQKRLPHFLIIVNPKGYDFSKEVFDLIPDKSDDNLRMITVENNRTKGISGALNSGIIQIKDLVSDIDQTYIDFLDCDVKVKNEHLEICSKYFSENDVVITGTKDGIYPQGFTNDFIFEDLFNEKENIRFSDMCINLKSILLAGMFDENLVSFIGRDLLIRLSEIKQKIISISTETIDYDVKEYEEDSNSKEITKRGIQLFWDKYSPRLPKSERKKYINKAKKLYDINLNTKKKQVKNEEKKFETLFEPFHLIIGVIHGSNQEIKTLLKDIIALKKEHFVKGIDTVILENCSEEQDLAEIDRYLNQISKDSIIIPKKQQIKDAKKGMFGIPFSRGRSQLPISKARTLLQKYLYVFVKIKGEQNSIIWIIDEDMRIHKKVHQYIPLVPAFREELGIDVLLGNFEGGSPNPPINAVRVQLLDLFNNLERLNDHDDEEVLDDHGDKNIILRKKYPDYYYDLSRRHYGHLESPYWLNKNDENETVIKFRKRIFKNLNKILTGEPFFRPLISDIPNNPLKKVKTSANRGGNAFIFNHDTLRKTPNPTITIDGEKFRRSDMLWALINLYHYNYDIRFVDFPVYHEGSVDVEPEFDISKTVGELFGASLYAGLSEFMSENPNCCFKFDNSQLENICNITIDYLENRRKRYELNFKRIQGLMIALEKYENFEEVEDFLLKLKQSFSKENIEKFRKKSHIKDIQELKSCLKSIEKQVVEYSNAEDFKEFLRG